MMHSLNRFNRLMIFLLAPLGTAGCPTDEDNGMQGDGPTNSGPTDTTAGIDDPEAFCAQFTEPADCTFLDEAQSVYCSWMEVTPASIEAGACVLGDPVGSCHALTGNSTDPGCGPPPGCDGDPFYLDDDGALSVFLRCGGAGPLDAQPCTYVEPGVFEPAECGCLCDEDIGGSSSSGGSSGG